MISLCVVTLEQIERHIQILLDSVVRNTKHITEVNVVSVNGNKEHEVHQKGHITIHRWYIEMPAGVCLHAGHGIGLHYGLERSTQEYILFTDPDVFLKPAVDETYLNLTKEHSLDCIGTSHHNSPGQAGGFFPCVFNFLTKREKLPPKNWLKGELKLRDTHISNIKTPLSDYDIDGFWLCPGPLPERWDRMPNTNGWYDTGCNLLLWAQEQNWRWLAFQTPDCHNYSTKYFRNNFGLKGKLAQKPLIYHAIGSTNMREQEWLDFRNAYLEMCNDNPVYSGDEHL